VKHVRLQEQVSALSLMRNALRQVTTFATVGGWADKSPSQRRRNAFVQKRRDKAAAPQFSSTC